VTPAERLRDEGLVLVDDFVPAATCAAMLRELRFVYWAPSTVVNRRDDAIVSFASAVRTSESAGQWWFTDELLGLLGGVESRLRTEFGIDPDRLETWQATRYHPGGLFRAHDDAGLWRNEPAGERTTTVLLYLDRPEAGGATEFPCLDLVVEPRPGRLLLWQNLRPDGSLDRLMRHAALPVERGAKTVLVTWGRQRPVRETRQKESA
jgi:hypothetical protein